MDRREQLVSVFADTQAYYTENRLLADAVQRSRKAVKLYEENNYPELPEAEKAGRVTVTRARSFEVQNRHQSRRRGQERLQRAGGKPLPLLHALSHTEPAISVGAVLRAQPRRR